MNIRAFRQEDAFAVYKMIEETEELHACGLHYSEKAVRNWHIDRKNDVILVAEEGNSIVGFILAIVNQPEPECAIIENLAITPECRGRKIGSQLLSECFRHLKLRKVSFVSINVKADLARSISFWKKHKFKGDELYLWMYREI